MENEKALKLREQLEIASTLPGEKQPAALYAALFAFLSDKEQESFFLRFNAEIIVEEDFDELARPGDDFEPKYSGDGFRNAESISNWPMTDFYTVYINDQRIGRFDDEQEAVTELLTALLADFSVAVFISFLRNPLLTAVEPLVEQPANKDAWRFL